MGRTYLLAGLLVGAGLGFAAPAFADTKAGVDAWTSGDFAGAVKVWQVEAAKGDGGVGEESTHDLGVFTGWG